MNQHSLLYSLLLAALTAATTAATADDTPLKGDLAKIQGKWTATAEPRPGLKLSWLYQIEGNTVRIRVTTPNGQEVEHKGEFKINESGKPHKTIDWIKRTDPTSGVELPDIPAIYAFENDDVLKICQPAVGRERPERPMEFGPDFPAGGRSGGTLKLTRVKETAKTAP